MTEFEHVEHDEVVELLRREVDARAVRRDP